MTDWHSHVLPGIDDGSRSVKESLEMLSLLRKQGVDRVIATPHFYADNNTVEEFLDKREQSLARLRNEMNEELPEVIPGAEVCYYPGISKLKGLERLCTEGTDVLLLEMPFNTWTMQTVNEVLELALCGEYTVLLAHIDRYIRLGNDSAIEKLCRAGVYFQVNPDFRESFITRRKVMKLIKDGYGVVLGSDSHNMRSRRPQIDEAISYIRKKSDDEIFGRVMNTDIFDK